jgi:plastocyanin
MRRPALLAALLVAAPLAAAPLVVSHAVSQKGKVFSKTTLTVKPGDEIVFTNDDEVVHNVFSSSAGFAFNLKGQAPGTSSKISFDKEGTAEVRCAFHPTMKLSITVAN